METEITVQKLRDGWLFFMPLCPSTNARMQPVRMGRHCQSILTTEARNYIASTAIQLKAHMKVNKIKPIETFTYMDLWFILPRTNCDAHNYGKVLFDAMEEGGFVTNDKFILPRIMGVSFDAKNSAVVAKIPFCRTAPKP
jgi:Holliday junction resolvase RusA-like endonuclease